MNPFDDEAVENQASDPLTPYQRFRHSGWLPMRQRVRAAMVAGAAPQSRLNRFDRCGSCCSVWTSKSTGRTVIRGDFCRCRACIPCGNARRALITSNLTAFLRNRQLRFMTLTLKHRDRPLGQSISRIWACFKLLRKEPDWKQHVSGFAAFLEAKHNSRTGCWHVHLHILCEGRFWEQRSLSRLWHTVTGDSMIVDVRAVTDARGGILYASKYASKPFDSGGLQSFSALTEACREFASRRLWLIGGSWKGPLKLLAAGPDPGDWEFVCGCNSLWADAAAGQPPAVALTHELTMRPEEKISRARPPP